MTITDLNTFVSSQVTAAKQAGAWSASTGNILGLLDKVGKQITIDGDFQDKLPEFDGDELPFGKTIEEYFIDLTLPRAYDSTGANALAPSYPTVENAAYSYSLGRKVIPTSEPMDNVERAALGSVEASNFISKIVEKLANSRSIYTYAMKKQLLANFGTKAFVAGLKATIAAPVDATTGEAFIKQIKSDVEVASFANEKSINGQLIGAAPEGELTLYILKGNMPSIDVDTMAGAFNQDKLAMPCKIKVVDDFGKGVMTTEGGSVSANVYAILVDTRGIKLHRGYQAIREQENADGDFMNFFDHSEYTGYLSKNVFVKVYAAA